MRRFIGIPSSISRTNSHYPLYLNADIVIIDGYKFFFYANEHEPKHIHIMKGGDFAKINFASLQIVHNYMKPKDLKKALEVVTIYKDEFERKWDEYFGQR